MKKITLLIMVAFIMNVTNIYSQTWSLQSSGTTESLYSIVPTTFNNAFSVGDNQVLVKTSNQGSFWTQQLIGTDIACRSMYFTSQNVGYVVGGSTSTHYIYKTTDGGVTWPLNKSGSPASMYGIDFLDANTGYAIRSSPGSSEIYKTLDGGVSWGLLTGSTSSTWIKHIAVVDANKVFCVGTSGSIRKTSDGGTTWTTTVFGSYELTDVAFPSTSVGFISGFNGTVLKTTDGGTSWTALTLGSTANFYSLAFLDVNRGFVVGQNGAIFYTGDGGTTWTNQTGVTGNTLINVRFLDQNLGYACGINGTIIKYINTIGVEEISNDISFDVFPNPANDQIYIDLKGKNISHISINLYNNLGENILELNETLPSGSFIKTIDTRPYANGVYYISVRTEKDNWTKKIHIAHP